MHPVRPAHVPGWHFLDFGAGQEDIYRNLPAYRSAQPNGMVLSCWRLGFWERVRLLFSGRLYFGQMTFHYPLQPQLPSLDPSVIIESGNAAE